MQTWRLWVKKSCGYAGHHSPNHNKARQNISFYLRNINNWRAHESRMNCYSNNNKTNLNKTICISYGMYCVCSNGPIRSQRSLLLTWSPFHDFSQWGTSPCNHSLSYYPGTLSFSHISASRLKLGHPRMICHFCPGATIIKRDRRNHHWDLDMDKQSCRIK